MGRPDPEPWPWWQIVLWALLALLAVALQGPGVVRAFRPDRERVVDFFQEWAAAKFYFDGQPVYTPQRLAVSRYLGYELDPRRPFNEVNAHPPAAVLLALPFARLDYPQACLTWNVLSFLAFLLAVFLTIRELCLRFSPWALLPALTLALFCGPLISQLFYVQLNALLALLVVLAWVADRRGRPTWAGVALGTAAAIKLFPAFLFLYFLFRGRRPALAAGALTVAAWTLATLAVFGPETWRAYCLDVLPQLDIYRDRWANTSLPGFWFKLLAGTGLGGHSAPLLYRPALAELLAGASILGLAAVIAPITIRCRTREAEDHAFALGVLAMLLASPIAWPHYFLMLTMPLLVWWDRLPPSGVSRLTFRCCLVLLWLNPELYYHLAFRADAGNWFRIVASPGQTLAVTSLQLYALLALFALGLATSRKSMKSWTCVTEDPTEDLLARGAVTPTTRALPVRPGRA